MARRPETVGFRVSEVERKRLAAEAQKRDIPVSYVVREALKAIIRVEKPHSAA